MNASNQNEDNAQRGARPDGAAPAADRLRTAAHERIDHVADTVRPAVDRVADAAHDTVERVSEAATHAADTMAAKSEEIHHLQDRLVDDCRTYVRAHPLKSLGYAAAAGFLLTRLLRG